MKITLKDGSVREYSEAMTVNDIAFDISGGLGRAAWRSCRFKNNC